MLYVAGKYEPAAAACKQFLTQFAKSPQRDTALYVLGLSRRAVKDADGARKVPFRLALRAAGQFSISETVVPGGIGLAFD